MKKFLLSLMAVSMLAFVGCSHQEEEVAEDAMVVEDEAMEPAADAVVEDAAVEEEAMEETAEVAK